MATGTGSTGPARSSLPTEVVEDLLADDRRRTVLACLDDAQDPLVVEDLAAAVLARERETETGEIPADDRQAVRTELYDTHLPPLTETQVVEYDSVLDAVELVDEEVADRVH